MASREYAVDVAAYQPTSLTAYHNHGAKSVLVKVTEGISYFNPKAYWQIKSAHANHMYVHGYHFATFGHSVHQAKREARHFVAQAKLLSISKKRYLALDWEAGDGNVVVGSKYQNTKAILAFMSAVKKAGWKPLLYAGASLLRNNIDINKVVKKFGTCIWVASYPTAGATYQPNFNYFPSMKGVAIWQFTDDWKGLNVDGNITLININMQKKTTSHKASKPKHAVNVQKKAENKPKLDDLNVKVVYAPIINHNPNYKIRLMNVNGHYMNQYIRTNTRWKVFGTKIIKGRKCYKLGTDKQWVPAKYLKIIK